jgi:hypothetical protein
LLLSDDWTTRDEGFGWPEYWLDISVSSLGAVSAESYGRDSFGVSVLAGKGLVCLSILTTIKVSEFEGLRSPHRVLLRLINEGSSDTAAVD